jgi:hypothetical protein
MAKTTTTKPAPNPEVDPNASYRLVVASRFVWAGARLAPLADLTVSGAWLIGLLGSEHADQVTGITKV